MMQRDEILNLLSIIPTNGDRKSQQSMLQLALTGLEAYSAVTPIDIAFFAKIPILSMLFPSYTKPSSTENKLARIVALICSLENPTIATNWIFQSYKNESNLHIFFLLVLLEYVKIGRYNLDDKIMILEQCRRILQRNLEAKNISLLLDSIVFLSNHSPYHNELDIHFQEIVQLLLGWRILPNLLSSASKAIDRSLSLLTLFWDHNQYYATMLQNSFLKEIDTALEGIAAQINTKQEILRFSNFSAFFVAVAEGTGISAPSDRFPVARLFKQFETAIQLTKDSTIYHAIHFAVPRLFGLLKENGCIFYTSYIENNFLVQLEDSSSRKMTENLLDQNKLVMAFQGSEVPWEAVSVLMSNSVFAQLRALYNTRITDLVLECYNIALCSNKNNFIGVRKWLMEELREILIHLSQFPPAGSLSTADIFPSEKQSEILFSFDILLLSKSAQGAETLDFFLRQYHPLDSSLIASRPLIQYSVLIAIQFMYTGCLEKSVAAQIYEILLNLVLSPSTDPATLQLCFDWLGVLITTDSYYKDVANRFIKVLLPFLRSGDFSRRFSSSVLLERSLTMCMKSIDHDILLSVSCAVHSGLSDENEAIQCVLASILTLLGLQYSKQEIYKLEQEKVKQTVIRIAGAGQFSHSHFRELTRYLLHPTHHAITPLYLKRTASLCKVLGRMNIDAEGAERFLSTSHSKWFWFLWESASLLVTNHLNSHLGNPMSLFGFIEKVTLNVMEQEPSPHSPASLRHLLLFIGHLEKRIYIAMEGALCFPLLGMESFFQASNRTVCLRWFARLRLPALQCSITASRSTDIIFHATIRLSDIMGQCRRGEPKKILVEAAHFALIHLCLSLCVLRDCDALSGMLHYYKQEFEGVGIVLELPWRSAIQYQAAAQYERAASEYEKILSSEEFIKLSKVTGTFIMNQFTHCLCSCADWQQLDALSSSFNILCDKYTSSLQNYDTREAREGREGGSHSDFPSLPPVYTPILSHDAIRQSNELLLLQLMESKEVEIGSGVGRSGRILEAQIQSSSFTLLQELANSQEIIPHKVNLCVLSILQEKSVQIPVDTSLTAGACNMLLRALHCSKNHPHTSLVPFMKVARKQSNFRLARRLHARSQPSFARDFEYSKLLHVQDPLRGLLQLGNIVGCKKEELASVALQQAKWISSDTLLLQNSPQLSQFLTSSISPIMEGIDQTFICEALGELEGKLLSSAVSLQPNHTKPHIMYANWCYARAKFRGEEEGRAEAYKSAVFHYFQFLASTSSSSIQNHLEKKEEDYKIIATLRLLKILGKDGTRMQNEFSTGLSTTPPSVWRTIIPQLFSRLLHPQPFIQEQIGKLIGKIGKLYPSDVIYPILVRDSDPTDTQGQKQYHSISKILAGCFPVLYEEVQILLSECTRLTQLWPEIGLQLLQRISREIPSRFATLQVEYQGIQGSAGTIEEKQARLKQKYTTIMKFFSIQLSNYIETVGRLPETPFEIWFQRTFLSRLQRAMALFISPHSMTEPSIGWKQFECLIEEFSYGKGKKGLLSNLLRRSDVVPELDRLEDSVISMPGLGRSHITIQKFAGSISVLPSKTKPKKIAMLGSDGRSYPYLVKGHEDLHLDERIMQFLGVANHIFTRLDSPTSPSKLRARTFAVIPIGQRSGLIQWVDRSHPMSHVYKQWKRRTSPNTTTPSTMEVYHTKLMAQLVKHGVNDISPRNRKNWPKEAFLHVFQELKHETPSDLLEKEFWCSSTSSEAWWEKKQQFTRSTAVMSIIGYLLGLGDRHLENILIDFTSGEVVHIDYNICFERGRKLPIPELVPFRLTGIMETAFGPSGRHGTFTRSCCEVLQVMQRHQGTLLTLLEAFVYDPLLDWTTDKEETKKRLRVELDTNLTLFTSRGQDFKRKQSESNLLLAALSRLFHSVQHKSMYQLYKNLFASLGEEESLEGVIAKKKEKIEIQQKSFPHLHTSLQHALNDVSQIKEDVSQHEIELEEYARSLDAKNSFFIEFIPTLPTIILQLQNAMDMNDKVILLSQEDSEVPEGLREDIVSRFKHSSSLLVSVLSERTLLLSNVYDYLYEYHDKCGRISPEEYAAGGIQKEISNQLSSFLLTSTPPLTIHSIKERKLNEYKEVEDQKRKKEERRAILLENFEGIQGLPNYFRDARDNIIDSSLPSDINMKQIISKERLAAEKIEIFCEPLYPSPYTLPWFSDYYRLHFIISSLDTEWMEEIGRCIEKIIEVANFICFHAFPRYFQDSHSDSNDHMIVIEFHNRMRKYIHDLKEAREQKMSATSKVEESEHAILRAASELATYDTNTTHDSWEDQHDLEDLESKLLQAKRAKTDLSGLITQATLLETTILSSLQETLEEVHAYMNADSKKGTEGSKESEESGGSWGSRDLYFSFFSLHTLFRECVTTDNSEEPFLAVCDILGLLVRIGEGSRKEIFLDFQSNPMLASFTSFLDALYTSYPLKDYMPFISSIKMGRESVEELWKVSGKEILQRQQKFSCDLLQCELDSLDDYIVRYEVIYESYVSSRSVGEQEKLAELAARFLPSKCALDDIYSSYLLAESEYHEHACWECRESEFYEKTTKRIFERKKLHNSLSHLLNDLNTHLHQLIELEDHRNIESELGCCAYENFLEKIEKSQKYKEALCQSSSLVTQLRTKEKEVLKKVEEQKGLLVEAEVALASKRAESLLRHRTCMKYTRPFVQQASKVQRMYGCFMEQINGIMPLIRRIMGPVSQRERDNTDAIYVLANTIYLNYQKINKFTSKRVVGFFGSLLISDLQKLKEELNLEKVELWNEEAPFGGLEKLVESVYRKVSDLIEASFQQLAEWQDLRSNLLGSSSKEHVPFVSSTIDINDGGNGELCEQVRNKYAMAALNKIRAKLQGTDEKNPSSTPEEQVRRTIEAATSLDNLSAMYEGWTAWV